MKALELVGQQFGRLVVIAKAGRNRWGRLLWWCLCECGEYVIIPGNSLKRKLTESCGCLHRELLRKQNTTHGGYNTPEHRSWRAMKDRCLNKKSPRYKDYGDRGIKIEDDRWLNFKNFYADMGNKIKGTTLERLNNEKGYNKKNCCWDTYKKQSHNKRIHKKNTTGCSGVCWDKKIKKYKARIGIDYKEIHLGYFNILQDAINIRKIAELKYWGKVSNA